MKGLSEEDVAADPIVQFASWLEEAWRAAVPQADTMVLATSSQAGRPSARAVILRAVDHGFVFYTNHESPKARDLGANPVAAAVLVWIPMHRQVRIEGTIERLTDEESDAYFATRPRGAQISAVVSPQSTVVPNRQALDDLWIHFDAEHPGGIPRPEHWGGYRIVPETIEFWQGRENRFHDRLRYSKQGSGWLLERLAP